MKQECFIRYNLFLSIYLRNQNIQKSMYIINHRKIILFMQEANRQKKKQI